VGDENTLAGFLSAEMNRAFEREAALLKAAKLVLVLNDNPLARVPGFEHGGRPLLDPKAREQLRAAIEQSEQSHPKGVGHE
jgi:hypothetical protein